MDHWHGKYSKVTFTDKMLISPIGVIEIKTDK